MIDAHGRGYMKQTIYFNLCATASTNSFSRKLANLQFRSFIFLSSSYPVLLAVCVVIFSSPATPKFDFLIDSLVGMSIDWLIDWCSDGCVGSNWEAKLISDLMRGYNRHARPTMNVSKPVDTTIAFYLTKILGLVSYEATHSYKFRGCRCVSYAFGKYAFYSEFCFSAHKYKQRGRQALCRHVCGHPPTHRRPPTVWGQRRRRTSANHRVIRQP